MLTVITGKAPEVPPPTAATPDPRLLSSWPYTCSAAMTYHH